MDDKDKSGNNDATVIQPQKAPHLKDSVTNIPQTAVPQTAKSVEAPTLIKPSSGLAPDQLEALTKIRDSLKASDNSVGFDNAREAANLALASNKILLNNRFVLDSTIGCGGMGTVYKARDLRKVEANNLNPFIAVKVLNQDFQNHPDAFVTLQREASKAQALAHPNIVSVHDFDRDGDVIYMTMELLEGEDVESLIRANASGLDTNEAIRLVKGYCAALIYAHKKNIVHSDLKPGNIFITRDGAKVLDFGIARFSANSADQAADQDNFDAGDLGALTPAYASLEMINREPPDQRDDVFAAAIIAYELFSGKHPYQRRPADVALQENLKPARLTKLNKRQWQAMELALKLKRNERTPTIEQFLNELTYVRRNLWLKVAASLLFVVATTLAYYNFFAPDELTAVIASTLKKSAQCYESRDYVCALDSANAVLKLDPDNTQAKLIYKESSDANQLMHEEKYLAEATSCIEANQLDCARDNLAALKQVAPLSKSLESIQGMIELKIAKNTVTQCFSELQYDCAIEHSLSILNKNPDDGFALDMIKRSRELQLENKALIAGNQKNYNENMAKAEDCLARKKYDCSMQLAREALKYKSGDASAETLYQKASYVQIQQQEALMKAKNVHNQGLTCFNQKNYSCAIAKSESALEFLPDFQDAIKLKQDAQKEVAKLKSSIVIQ